LKNGISYFTGPLLSWTLVGVIKSLLKEILHKDFDASAHLEVLQLLVQPPECPRTVILLVAHGILALVNDPKAQALAQGQEGAFNPAVLKAIAEKALGLNMEDAAKSLSQAFSLSPQGHWMDHPQKLIQDALSQARLRKVPAFDVPRCIAIAGPTTFLRLLWEEASAAATNFSCQEIARRLFTNTLTFPQPTESMPPLLPIFLHNVLPGIMGKVDAMIPGPEQTVYIELLVAIISGSLTGAFHVEWAIRAVAGNNPSGSGVRGKVPATQLSSSIARRLAMDLKKSNTPTANIVLQRLSSSQSFISNFPMMAS